MTRPDHVVHEVVNPALAREQREFIRKALLAATAPTASAQLGDKAAVPTRPG